MKFWDASAVVPLILAEAATAETQTIARKDPAILVWWGAEVECASAIAREAPLTMWRLPKPSIV